MELTPTLSIIPVLGGKFGSILSSLFGGLAG